MQGVPRRVPVEVSSVPHRIRVWDLPTRIFHWTLAALVVFSLVTGKIGGSWMEWHLRSGYAILALLLFRLAWGLFGSATSRFSTFLRGPKAFFAYARDVVARRHRIAIGHNPMGGWMVVFMLLVLLAQAATGLFADDEIATTGPLAVKVSNAMVAKLSSFHFYNSWVVIGLVAMHVIAIAIYWLAFKDDLVRPMWHGWREVETGTVEPGRRAVALAAVLLLVSAAAVYWLVAMYPKG
jgi:cytochrome b